MRKVAITGAFGFSGKYIARKLLQTDTELITLTNSYHKENPFGELIKIFPLNFNNKTKLTESLTTFDTLINTYWVRFDHKLFTHHQAVINTKILIDAAVAAGVKRIVHVSITNPDFNSDLPYFRGKAELEKYLLDSGISYCILRPAVIFGREDILINNIAWIIRHFPLVPVFGTGEYKLQPIYVDDLAALAASKAFETNNEIINAFGPETFSYLDLIKLIINNLELKRKIINITPATAYYSAKILGFFLKDILITKEEIKGLMRNLLFVESNPTGKTKLSDWVVDNKKILGINYSSEMARRR